MPALFVGSKASRRGLTAATLALLAIGCRFDASVPAGALIRCRADKECPAPLACQVTLGRCVPAEELDLVPPGVVPSSTRLVLTPARENALVTVDAMTWGTTASLRFVTTEPVAQPPALTTDPPLECAHVRAEATDHELVCSIPRGPSPRDGPVSLRVTLVDAAGNVAEVDLSSLGLKLDTTPPPRPDVDGARVIVYERIPWGSDEAGEAPRYTVSGAAGAALEAAVVRVFSGLLLRGEGRPSADGAFGPLQLIPYDVPQVEIDAVDSAGNASPRATVRYGKIVASLRGKLVDRPTPNPHRFAFVTAFGAGSSETGLLERGASAGIAATDNALASVEGSPSFRAVDSALLTRLDGVAWDERRARAVVFGASPDAGFGVLEWNGHRLSHLGSFEDREGDGTPRSVMAPAVSYDERLEATLLIGGLQDGDWSGATWAYRPPTFERLAPGPPLGAPQAFFDTARNQTVLVGLPLDGGVASETWRFDGASWSSLNAPLDGVLALVAWDRRRGVALGVTAPLSLDAGAARHRPVAFDGRQWSELDAGQAFDRRAFALLVYDELQQRFLLSGGSSWASGSQVPLADSWTFDGAAWQQLLDSGYPQGPAHRGVYDPVRREPVLLRPFTVFAFDDGGWVSRTPPISALPAGGTARLTCAASLGGCVNADDTSLYRLEDAGWRRTSLSTDAGMSSSSMGWHEQSQQLVWAGQTRTLTWSPATDAGFAAWLSTPDGGPLFTGPLPALFDQGPSLLLASADRSVHAWTGSGWAPSSTIPSARSGFDWVAVTSHADAGLWLQTAVAGSSGCGGASLPPEAASYLFADGGFAPSPSGPPPLSAAMYDPRREGSWAFGGVDEELMSSDQLFFRNKDGGWEPRAYGDPELDGSPSPRTRARLAYDPLRGVGVLFGGGATFGSPLNKQDTWVFELGQNRPAARIRFDVSAAPLPANAALEAATLRAVAGASGEGGAATRLDGWRGFIWRERTWIDDTQGAPGFSTSAPGEGTVRTTDQASLRRELELHGALDYALAPVGTNGGGAATLAVDSVELTLEYTLP